MVAHVLRLRIALLVGAARGGARRVVLVVLALALVATVTIAAALAVHSLVDGTADVAQTVIVLGGAATAAGFLVAPVLAGAVDPLDPRRFAVFGMDVPKLPWVLALASVVSVPSLAAIALLATVGVVGSSFGEPLAAVLAAVVAVMIVLLSARVGMALNAQFLPERRPRELTGLFALAVIVLAVPVGVFLSSLHWEGSVPDALQTAVGVLSVTPWGAAFAFPFAIAAGDQPLAWASGAVALLTLALLLLLWRWLVIRALTTTERPVTVRERHGLGWFSILPPTVFGAIAARSLVYWLRDRRYVVNLVVVPIAGILTIFPLLIAGVPLQIAVLIPVPVMALFLGWLPHNDVAYDSTAFWLHVVSGIRGGADRWGRLIPAFLVTVPVLAVGIPVTLAIADHWSFLPALIGVCVSLFLTGLGLSSITSVLSPYPVSRPGDSPFQQPQRSSSGGVLGQAITLLGALLFSTPAIWLAVVAVVDRAGEPALGSLWAGLLIGAIVLSAGAAIGARIFQRGGTRLMEFVETT